MTNPGFSDISQYRDVESLNYYRILLEQGKSKKEALHILAARSRDNARTPMQWTAESRAGFTTGRPWIQIADNHTTINAAAELSDPDSIWSYYQRLIKLRKSMSLISEGRIHFVGTSSEEVIAYERLYRDERMLVLCSFSSDMARPLGTASIAGGKLLIGNYSDVATDHESLLMRPYETLAFLWS